LPWARRTRKRSFTNRASQPARAGYALAVRPSLIEMIAAAALVIVLAGLVVFIVVSTVPPGGPPTLQ